jgi:hypothetical protein
MAQKMHFLHRLLVAALLGGVCARLACVLLALALPSVAFPAEGWREEILPTGSTSLVLRLHTQYTVFGFKPGFPMFVAKLS